MEFTIIDKDGKEIECEIVLTFKDESNNIDYIVYTDGTKDEDGDLEIYSARYVIENDKYILQAIENEYEWNMIDNILESRFNEVGDNNG